MGAKFGAFKLVNRFAPGSALARRMGRSSLRSADDVQAEAVRTASARGMKFDPERRRMLRNNARRSRMDAIREGRSTDEQDALLRQLGDL